MEYQNLPCVMVVHPIISQGFEKDMLNYLCSEVEDVNRPMLDMCVYDHRIAAHLDYALIAHLLLPEGLTL
jgi:hypothetical protein